MQVSKKFTAQWHNVTAQTLQEDIIPLYKPAILKNAINDWDITTKVAKSPNEILNYREEKIDYPPIGLFIGDKSIHGRYAYGQSVNERNFKQVETNLENILAHLNNYTDDSPVTAYAGAVDIRSQLPQFERFNPFPILPKDKQAAPRAWIGNAAQISNHFDLSDNIACVVSGKREFTLFPPEQVSNLYVAPIDKTLAGPPASLVDISQPDFDAHPRYAQALESAEIATLEPGDALYIPSLWWHSVKSTGKFCMLVNYWWNNPKFRQDNTMMAMIHGLFSISHLPRAERQAWKSLFEYFVFQLDEVALSHLPENQRGVHSKMTPELHAMIYNYFTQNMKST